MKLRIRTPRLLFLICMLATTAFAGVTGKIAGKVVDTETGEPLPGANIIIEGTQMGAAANLQGEFIIINVPPGVYTLKISMMGYKTQVRSNVQVSIDLTTQVNVKLEPSVIAGEEVTVVAERPLVRMDQTSSMATVGAQQIADLPVQTIGEVLELQAGVVNRGGWHIRGGRADEVAFWIDGVPVTNVNNYSQGITVENYAIQELQVISGTFNAEYGQAMSGIVNIITKEGSPKFNGQVRAYVGDYVSNRDEFEVLDRVVTLYDESGKAVGVKGITSNPLRLFNPEYNYDLSLSGPIPGTKDKLTFFVNGRTNSGSGYYYGRNWFLPTGVPGDSSLVKMSEYHHNSLQGKLTWRPSGVFKLSYNALWNKDDSPRSFSQQQRYVPLGTSQSHSLNQSHIVSLNHVLSPKTFYEVRFNYLDYRGKSYVFADPNARPDYYIYIYPDTTADGIVLPDLTLNPLKSKEDSIRFEQLKQERRRYQWIIDPNGPIGYIHPDSNSVPASYSFWNDGSGRNYSRSRTQSWIAKFDLSSQIDRINLVKAGFEFRTHRLDNSSYSLIAATNPASNEEIVPYMPTIPPIDSPQRSDYVRTPKEFSAYIQDKMELKEIIFNIGLRFDWFDANYVVPTFSDDPDIYHPIKPENTYKNWTPPPAGLNQAEYDAYLRQFEKYTPEERRAFMHKKVKPKMQLSPRLGIAYPITDAGVIHFSYGHFFQIPAYNQMYTNPDFKINPSGGNIIFGNADLNAKRTVQYEIGLQQQIAKDLGIDVTIFYKDIRDWVGTSPLVRTAIPSVLYSTYENKDYSNVRGITFKMEKRMAANFSANLDYTFQIAEGSYSNPNDAFNAQVNNNEPRLNLIPLDWDRRHSLNMQLIYYKNRWTVSAIGRFYSGFPYTPSFPRAQFVGGSALSSLPENSSRNPNQKVVDLRINRQFRLAGLDFNLFAYINNLFDSDDAVAVYSDTGSPDYTTNITPSRVSYDSKRVGTVEHYVLQPGYYTAPRQIQVGFSVGF
ncbi:MAG: TonB-dependent receptor [candidate division KSB1 bacterium]|nr:TonB-dependent receptor [candidate division KSB1 bacterium]